MKNTTRYCKNQGSEGQKIIKMQEKTTSEGKLKANFRLSWLVKERQFDATWKAKRHQVGAQRGFGNTQGSAKCHDWHRTDHNGGVAWGTDFTVSVPGGVIVDMNNQPIDAFTKT